MTKSNSGEMKFQHPKYLWFGDAKYYCDIRRYAFSHYEAIAQMKKPIPKSWTLYKLVKVNKRRVK